MPAIFFLIVLTQIITANYSSTVTQCAHHYDIFMQLYIMEVILFIFLHIF